MESDALNDVARRGACARAWQQRQQVRVYSLVRFELHTAGRERIQRGGDDLWVVEARVIPPQIVRQHIDQIRSGGHQDEERGQHGRGWLKTDCRTVEEKLIAVES